MPEETVVFGEISLAGEVRPVAQADLRLREAAKLGFSRAWVPPKPKAAPKAVSLVEIDRLHQLKPHFSERQ